MRVVWRQAGVREIRISDISRSVHGGDGGRNSVLVAPERIRMMRVPKAMDSTSEFDSNKPETTLTYIGGPYRGAGAWDRQACAQAACPCEPCDYRGA
jgi:hypothetical protein